MKPYEEHISTFEAMFIGYANALNRFEAAAKTNDPVITFAPLFEALNWAVALDDRTAKHFAPEGKPLGRGWRKRIPNAEIMAGVRLVRNSVHHQWSDALRLATRGAHVPSRPSVGLFEWVWRPVDELPKPPRKKRPTPAAVQRYREHMEGQPARMCLDVLDGVFFTLQRLLEPHTIRKEPSGYVPMAVESDDDDSASPPSA